MIDLHAHIVLEETLGAAGPWGPTLTEAPGAPPCYRVGDYELHGVRYRDGPFMDVERRLEAMDRQGIDAQVLSPNPLTFLTNIDASTATSFARSHNDALAAIVDRHPDRLAGLAQLPTQDPVRAADELRRAVGELGLLGASIGTDLTVPLDDPQLDVLYATCIDLDVPLFLHPAPGGIDRPRRDPRLGRFDGDLWLGFAYEETIAVATLVLGGVLDRHGALDVCVSHGGGATSWLRERMVHGAATRGWAGPGAGAAEVERSLSRIWWDAHVGGPGALGALVGAFGTDRLVAGTNLAGWDQSLDPSHGRDDLARTFDANARRLLRLGSESLRRRR